MKLVVGSNPGRPCLLSPCLQDVLSPIADQGKSAAIGALSGAGAGLAGEVLTKGAAIKVPGESVLTFQLDRDLKFVERRYLPHAC